MKEYCLALDLKDDPVLIAEYEKYHKTVWPEILQSIRDAGIKRMQFYRTSNRLTMIMETDDDFSIEKKSASDAANQKVQDWEKLMWKYQQAIPGSAPGDKWVLMKKIFEW